MKIAILAVAMFLNGVLPALSQSISRKGTIVLVHGAWSDASAWDHITPVLKAAGYEVIAVNLPGHGKDNTSFAGITMNTYVDVVKAVIGTRKDVILVGHSMGGVSSVRWPSRSPVR